MQPRPAPQSAPRLVPATVLLVVALCATLLTGAATRPDPVQAAPAQASHTRTLNAARLAFHDQMRKLWEDHVTWTRLAIVTFADGSAGFQATAARLLQNQADIGDAIKPYYGDAAGAKLTSLLNDHITIAVEILQAAKNGDTDAFTDAKARWYANADDIAGFLAQANPDHWPLTTVGPMMREHLDHTLSEAVNHLKGDWTADIAEYDHIHAQILDMADMLTDGIVGQFPAKFS